MARSFKKIQDIQKWRLLDFQKTLIALANTMLLFATIYD